MKTLIVDGLTLEVTSEQYYLATVHTVHSVNGIPVKDVMRLPRRYLKVTDGEFQTVNESCPLWEVSVNDYGDPEYKSILGHFVVSDNPKRKVSNSNLEFRTNETLIPADVGIFD